MAEVQTQPLRGPGGMIAVLKALSDDDHNKHIHLCSADYVLLITTADAGAARTVHLLTSDADWDRTLSLRLDGFAHDGKQVFGILTEGGKFPSVTLFDYNTADGKVQIIDLKERFAPIVSGWGKATFKVIATAAAGAIVVDLNSAMPLSADGHWIIGRTGDPAHRLPPSAPIQNLFSSGSGG